jgi:glycosidase
MGVDALRTDTVKHVECGNLLEYVNAWKAHRPGLFVFGENLVKGTGWGDLFGDDNAPSYIRRDWVYGDVTRLVTFLQNHDVGPDNDFRFRGDQWMAAGLLSPGTRECVDAAISSRKPQIQQAHDHVPR